MRVNINKLINPHWLMRGKKEKSASAFFSMGAELKRKSELPTVELTSKKESRRAEEEEQNNR